MPNYIENSSTNSINKEDSFLYAGRISNEKRGANNRNLLKIIEKLYIKHYWYWLITNFKGSI